MSELSAWNSFYVIVGSAAGALIGLQFVVLTLIASRSDYVPPEAGAAFTTPSVVHFAVALLLSAVASAPWRGITVIAVCWGAVGFGGIAYIIVVIRRMGSQTVYRPVFEDWLFHTLLQFAAYMLLAGAAFVARAHLHPSFVAVGAATFLLLFVGIHNAWDTVTYHVFGDSQSQSKVERKQCE